MTCEHKNFSKKKVTLNKLGLEYSTRTDVCSDCGAYVRNNEFEIKFNEWLQDSYKSHRTKFQIQCNLSGNLVKCAQEFLKSYPGVSESVFFRIITILSLTIIDSSEKLSSSIETLFDGEVYNSFMEDNEKKRFNIQFKPKMMLEIHDTAELLQTSMTSIVEDSILRVMTLLTSQDEKLKEFWENEIKFFLESFLKSA